jgi:hypothetical protein
MRLETTRQAFEARLRLEIAKASKENFTDRVNYLEGLRERVLEDRLDQLDYRMVRVVCTGVSGCGFDPVRILNAFVRKTTEGVKHPKALFKVAGQHWVMTYSPKTSKMAKEINRGSVTIATLHPWGSIHWTFGGRINYAGYFDRGENYSAELDAAICGLNPEAMPWADVAKLKSVKPEPWSKGWERIKSTADLKARYRENIVRHLVAAKRNRFGTNLSGELEMLLEDFDSDFITEEQYDLMKKLPGLELV